MSLPSLLSAAATPIPPVQTQIQNQRARPFSYSESDIYIPRPPTGQTPLQRVSSAQRPLLSFADTPLQLSIQTPRAPSPESPVPTPSPSEGSTATPKTRADWLSMAYRWSLRFSLHLALISLFETVFFWQFVSMSEDQALLGLVDSYTGKLFTSCAALTPVQRADFVGLVDIFINQTIVDDAGAAALTARTAFNHGLLRNSWLYCGSISTLFVLLAAVARRCSTTRDHRIRWSHIVGENLCLVTILGLYEWMFFHTVVFPYKTVSIPELDQHVVDGFQQHC